MKVILGQHVFCSAMERKKKQMKRKNEDRLRIYCNESNSK